MGSFQQISIGIVCLVAAFAFGNYVNHHPSGDHPRTADAESDPTARLTGNVQSRLVGEIQLTEKRPANIATMRSRLEPRFTMPSSSTDSGLSESKKAGSLPPPSQLEFNQAARKGPPTLVPSEQLTLSAPLNSTNGNQLDDAAVVPRVAKASDVPDFSTIMNELEGSSIGLQPIGKMPQHSNQSEAPAARAVVKPPSQNRSAPLKDLANEFKSAVSTSSPDASQPWNARQSADFTADDFAPRLKDATPELQAQPPRQETVGVSPPTDQAPISTAARYNVTPETSNRVVSREPMPPANANQSVLPPLLPNQDPSNAQRLAQLKPTSQRTARSVTQPEGDAQPQSELEAPASQSRGRIPFSLNDEGKRELAALSSRANSQLELNTTRFVDHVIQQGETLQSISKRYFGKPDYYLDIYLANRGKLKNPVSLETGIAIRIPIYE